ncbi:MAG: transcriptional regulator [Candidatus Taylorbacteria bacterium CG11_big_fil_rev_8_21_14_0_20_46_11]|uniref:Transcriptional regulator n=1 Tax=Candidatus Taylorbacteria bacterium CG11_big_fil_rev_8_21_14_0_20_46_11 TaxID=1975025 RepID=A0A2H0KA24_9BACT|nr:MAG: transcriptional regulator [Candidatus Taylorbacteria bacterium CG11_big_fil_rev_8_21_14_0_20_46_11]
MAKTVSNSLHCFRMKRNMTQESLAEALHVTRQTVIAIEKGNYTPSVALALIIAKFFDVHVEDIFTL